MENNKKVALKIMYHLVVFNSQSSNWLLECSRWWNYWFLDQKKILDAKIPMCSSLMYLIPSTDYGPHVVFLSWVLSVDFFFPEQFFIMSFWWGILVSMPVPLCFPKCAFKNTLFGLSWMNCLIEPCVKWFSILLRLCDHLVDF